jgi:hypothetical protein
MLNRGLDERRYHCNSIASAMLRTPSWPSMCARCTSTVRTLMPRS